MPRAATSVNASADEPARLRGILEAALDCIVSIDEHGRILEFNPAAEKTFGYRAADVIGRPMADHIIPPALRAQHGAGMARHLATGDARVIGRRIEITAMRADGSEFPCELTITRLRQDGRPMFTAFLRDITERRRAEEEIRRLNENLEREVESRTAELIDAVRALEHTRNRLETAQAIVHVGDVEVDVATGERVWSAEVFRLFGFDPTGPVPDVERTIARVHPEDQAAFRKVVDNARRGAISEALDFRVVLPDGALRWIRTIGKGVEPSARRPKRVALTLHDVTDRKSFERELLATIERERELGRLKAEFLHAVTHEYRTPLSIILSSAEILERYLERLPPADRVVHLQEIRRNAHRLAALVDEVLFLGRTEAGSIALLPVPVPLASFCREVADEAIAALGAERTVHLDARDLPERVMLDERLLRHILANLVQNALKYSTLDRPVWLSVCGEGEEIVLRVRDEGIGIPPEDQARLFQTFQRGSNVGTISGSGLGLVVVKRCVEAHGGAVTLRSAVGEGTEFTVRLPLDAPAAPVISNAIEDEQDPHSRDRGRKPHAPELRDDPQDGGIRRDRGAQRTRGRGRRPPRKT